MTSIFRNINLPDLVSLAILFSGLTIACILALASRIERNANIFLSIAMVLTVLGTTGLSPLGVSVVGPLLFCYVRQLTGHPSRFNQNDVLHFWPFCAYLWMPPWMAFITLAFYVWLSYDIIQQFYRRLQPVLMDRPRFAFRRLEKALVLLGIFCLLALMNNIFFVGFALVLMGIGVGALVKPDVPAVLSSASVDKLDAREKGRRLKEAVATNRFYEDPELTLATLAIKLNIAPHELSRIINTGLEKNFSDFINEFRVREIASKIADPSFERVTILGIAYDSGFNSKTTFNRVFKEMTGRTPVEYKNSLKNVVSIHNSAPGSRRSRVTLRSMTSSNNGLVTSKRNVMFKNYLKIAYRQLQKQKLYATIKVGGFALGIAACLLIALYIADETGHDRMYPGSERIYRLLGDGQSNTGWAWPAPMSRAIQNDFPEVEFAGRTQPNVDIQLRRADQTQNNYERFYAYVDQAFFNAMQLPVSSGNNKTALQEPQTMVITQSLADKYFHEQDAVGQVMILNNDQAHPYRITAVIANIPHTSHLQPLDFFLTLSGKEFWQGEQNDWTAYNYIVYVKLKAGTNLSAFEKKLNADILENYFVPQLVKEGNKDAATEAKKTHFHLQPVTDIHLHSYTTPDGFPHGDIRFVWLFGAIAAFILVIAGINFINLSTAKSANRAKEVGIRKVVGSYRTSLIYQFLTESTLYSYISFLLGIIIAWLLLPYFNIVAAKSLTMPWTQWWWLPVIVIAAGIVGVIAGLYPAVYLSAFRPVQVFKGAITGGSKGTVLRNGLVVFQFVASIVLMISTIVIYNQTHFILNRKIGFNKDQVLLLRGTNTLDNDQIKAFKNELSKQASIKSVSISDYLPVAGTRRNGNTFWIQGKEKTDDGVWGQRWQVDESYLNTLDIKLLEGRNFSTEMATDSIASAAIINQRMAKNLHLDNPVGKTITNYGGGAFRIIGVVQDFNYESMRGQIDPLLLQFDLSTSMMSIKISGTDVQQTIATVSAMWQKFAPNQPIRYTFLDQEFAAMYADVTRTGSIFTSFAILAISIACLGLFALSAFMAEQRRREIGIRKVLGASVQGITRLLSYEFIKLVLLAMLIASPIAWWAMNSWLQDFAYRTSISWWIFAAAGLGAVVIALLTISVQSIRAALANPVNSLRSE